MGLAQQPNSPPSTSTLLQDGSPALHHCSKRSFVCRLPPKSRPRREIPNSLHSSAMGSPASHKLKPFVHHRTLLPRHHFLPKKGKSVTHVSGTICYLCLGSLIIELRAIGHLQQLSKTVQ